MSKKLGSSRIPKFGSRIPQVKQAESNLNAVSPLQLGTIVHVGEREGILRFIGNVHFSHGIWCGIELSESNGKHDGSVNGIRYFACPPLRGLMVPEPKVTSKPASIESLEDEVSGPYSILIPQNIDDQTFNAEDGIFNRDATHIIDEHTFNRNRTQTIDDRTFNKNIDDRTFNKNIDERSFNRDTFTRPNNDNESLNDTKRRCTYNVQTESPCVNFDKPTTLSLLQHSTPNVSRFESHSYFHSTPFQAEALLRKLQLNNTNFEDANSKRDSLELEESLGILTPNEMVDFTRDFTYGNPLVRSSSLENFQQPEDESTFIVDKSSNELDNANATFVNQDGNKPEADLLSPNVVDGSVATDYSLGIIDEHVLLNLTIKTDPVMNMELMLDGINSSNKDYVLGRIDQTPSPEDLPLDPTPILEIDPKSETKSKGNNNSFVTSITSITSLDTGYQGDGEMSRPASRGADKSPLARRPGPRAQPRRQDPMTDSDFYTESDADNHEDNAIKGDRKAQVIDGTLYGVDPQAAADIYANNRENMDSSGIFTDMETRTESRENIVDFSPSDMSSKTISENSQNNLREILDKSLNSTIIISNTKEKANMAAKEPTNPKKRNAPSPAVSVQSNTSSPRHLSSKSENIISSAKKYKMPKRDVVSKVKAMMEQNAVLTPASEKKIVKKPAGRWDEVMNKISKTEPIKPNLKDIKSKVFSASPVSQRQIEQNRNKINSPNKLTPNNKTRRMRPRPANISTMPKTLGAIKSKTNLENSIHSSLSDLNANATTKKPLGAKELNVVQVTQVLTPSKLSPKLHQTQTATENKKSPPIIDTKSKKTTLPKSKEKILTRTTSTKDSGRGTVKGVSRTSPSIVRSVAPARAVDKKDPPVAEALAVLLQHLVFTVGAFKVPQLKQLSEKWRLEAEELKLSYQQLEESFSDEKVQHARNIEEERMRCRNNIREVIENHKDQLEQINILHKEEKQRLTADKDAINLALKSQHEKQLLTLKNEFKNLQNSHSESLEILHEENEAIRDQINEGRVEVDQSKKQINLLLQKIAKLENELIDKEKLYEGENQRLREENERLLGYGDEKGVGIQEVQSLRVVLELKQNEVADLRKALAEATHKADVLVGAEERSALLNARCEDLQLQLQRKLEYEQSLLADNQKLQDSMREECNQKRRLSQHNEELQWRLKQNKEVITKVLEQADETVLSRSLFNNASFNERNNTKSNFERTYSFRERTYSNISLEGSASKCRSKLIDFEMDDLSPPTSPKVKGVVEKSDSVSYVLDLDESPEIVASRIVRRSFRNSTPPKTSQAKSPTNKRPRIRGHPLSQSSSSSAILTSNKSEVEYKRTTSACNEVFNDLHWGESCASTPKVFAPKAAQAPHSEEEEEDDDLELPALPSELCKKKAAVLPSPKHLAGEAMISESNSEDENSSSSSQL